MRGSILKGQDRCVGCRGERLNVARTGLRYVWRDESFNLHRTCLRCAVCRD